MQIAVCVGLMGSMLTAASHRAAAQAIIEGTVKLPAPPSNATSSDRYQIKTSGEIGAPEPPTASSL